MLTSRLNAMVNKMGQNIAWRRAHDCPCRNPNSGAADYACTVCNGKGTYWDDPIEGIAAIAGQKVQQVWAKVDEYETGDQVMTLPSDSPLYAIGQFDRLLMLQSSMPFSAVSTHTGAETLPFVAHVIDHIAWKDNNQIVSGGIPAINADGTLTWATGEPPAGVQYAITGRKRPEYFIYKEYPQDRAHFGGQDLPRRVVARRMDLFGR